MPRPVSSEELVLKMQELPETLRSFLSSADVVEGIEEIQKTYTLPDHSAIALSRAIAWYVSGFLNAPELGAEFARIAPQGKLAELRGDIIKKIFIPFAPQLHSHGLNFEAIVVPLSPAPTFIPLKSPAPTPGPAITPAPKVEEKTSPPPIVIGQTSKPMSATTPTVTAPMPSSRPVPPVSAPRVTIAPQQPGVPVTPLQEISKEPKPETGPKAVRYTPPPVIREIPKVIPPVGRPPAAAPKPSETVIDLSTFQVATGESHQRQKPPADLPAEAGPAGNQPKAKGNVLDLKP